MRKVVSVVVWAACAMGCSDETKANSPVADAGVVVPPAPDGGGNPSSGIDCAGAKAGDKVAIVHRWEGEEGARFASILKPLADACQLTLEYEYTTSDDTLASRVDANAIDVAVWGTAELAKYDAKIKTLDSLGARKENYAEFFVSAGTRSGRWLGLPVKADVKTLVWYSPSAFAAKGYVVPTTWAELETLSDAMVAKGDVPWSMGLESGDATGWTGSDFIQDIFLVREGPAFVLDVLSGKIPYTDDRVKQAWLAYGKWARDPKYAVGGPEGTLATPFKDAIFKVFSPTPTAMMLKQAGFVRGELEKAYPGYRYTQDYDFFSVPGSKGLQGGADWLLALKDTPAVRALITYLSSTRGGASWAKSGLDLSPNRGAAGNYTDPVLSKFGETLANTAGFTPDIGDTIPGNFKNAEWKGIVDYLGGADLDPILVTIAAAQADAFK